MTKEKYIELSKEILQNELLQLKVKMDLEMASSIDELKGKAIFEALKELEE